MYPWDWRMLKWKADYSFLELHDLGCVWVSIPSGDFSLIKVREHQNCSPLRKQWNYPKRKIVQFFLKKKNSFLYLSDILTLYQILRQNWRGCKSPLLNWLPLEMRWFRPPEEVSAKSCECFQSSNKSLADH